MVWLTSEFAFSLQKFRRDELPTPLLPVSSAGRKGTPAALILSWAVCVCECPLTALLPAFGLKRGSVVKQLCWTTHCPFPHQGAETAERMGSSSLSSPSPRCYSFGIGPNVCHRLVKGLANVSKGSAEFLVEGERLQPKVGGGPQSLCCWHLRG